VERSGFAELVTMIRVFALSSQPYLIVFFYQYAPEAPFDEDETIVFFTQMIRQLGNLAHCTSPKQPNYLHYFHLLEQLATVRIGLVLVELCRAMEDNQDAMDTLVDLVHTLLTVVHIDHAQQVVNHAATAVASILEEFDATIPTPIIDQVLCCIAAGPVVMVTNPAAVEAAAKLSSSRKKNKKQQPAEPMPPNQIQQTNPSYLVAANAIRKVGEKVASPISAFLNGLWNGDAMIVEQTSLSTDDTNPNVWATIYELHKIAPPILTTVIGTVAASLTAPEEEMREKVVKLLGRLFYSPSSKIGTQFSPCFREWLRRHKDVSSKVRSTVAKYLVTILANRKVDLVPEATTTLIQIVSSDPDATVRTTAIHQICDLAYKNPTLASASLLKAVGDRVSSKSKQERRDALTGLAQIYHKHYMLPKLKQVQSGGDDCAIEIVMDALHGSNNEVLEDRYGWIAGKVFQCASFHDDVEMRSRVIQIVDEVLMGRDSTLSGTSRAVGLAVIMDSLDKPSNAHTWMMKLLSQRASLQKTLSKYIDARAELRKCKAGTEEALTADANAMECLEAVAVQTGALQPDREFLDKLHSARDNHIFKILATIANPTHSISARARALDELPKRCKSLGDATVSFVRTLARRCAMGHFVNVDVVRHVILLAHECLNDGDYQGCSVLLSSLKSITDVFSSLCSNKSDFANLLEVFSDCRAITNPQAKKQIKQLELLTTMSSILASAAQAFKSVGIDSELQDQLLHLCTRDGTPEQARHAVQAMAALLVNKDADDNEQQEVFKPLLKALTFSSKLSITSSNSKVIGTLAALSALAERAPSLFGKSERGTKAIKFALESVLLGRRKSVDGDESEDEDDESVKPTTPKSTKKEYKSNQSPGMKNSLEDEQLSIACRRAVASIEFLVTYIRSALIRKRVQKLKTEVPSSEQIAQIFELLHRILEDHGLPPSSRDRRECKSRPDRAALRECASIQLFRLCDTRLHLVDTYLSNAIWHTLSTGLLDEEKRVRSTVIGELGQMLAGKGPYAVGGPPHPANLRFVAMLVLCVDSDGNAIANGNAANIGKGCNVVKSAGKMGITGLRGAMEATLHQSRALGKDAERKFERVYKKKIMPEYSVPYGIHLLSLRRETPSAGGITPGLPGSTQLAASQSSDDGLANDVDESAHQKILRKRLKWLFEPLVLSLGDSADNISFLLRMTDMIANQFQPVDINAKSTSLVLSADSDDSLASPLVQDSGDTSKSALHTAKMKTTCAAAREVLLAFVKKDVNLTPYPGQIEVPTSVFTKLTLSTIKASRQQGMEVEIPVKVRIASRRSNSSTKKSSMARESVRESVDSHAGYMRSSLSSQDTGATRPVRSEHNECLAMDSMGSNQNEPRAQERDSMDSQDSRPSRSTRSKRKGRESLDSEESIGSSQKKPRARESLDSRSSGSNTFVASQDTHESPASLKMEHKRKTRVTFSPEFMTNSPNAAVASTHSPNSFGGGVSPIGKTTSPSPTRQSSERDSLSLDERTAGTTPPSVLRTVPTPASKESETGSYSRNSRRAHLSRKSQSSQESNATITSASQSSFEEEALAVETQTSLSKEEDDSRSGRKKSSGKRKKPAPVRIQVGLSQSSLESSAASGRNSARRATKSKAKSPKKDEFDFYFDVTDKENASKPNILTGGRKGKAKFTKGKASRKAPIQVKIKPTTGRGAATRRRAKA
jgi:hypothetical protein